MVSSRVSVNDFDSPPISNNKRATFNANNSLGFGMQNHLTGFQNQSFGNCQQSFENRQFYGEQNIPKNQFNFERPSNQSLPNIQKAQVVNARPD